MSDEADELRRRAERADAELRRKCAPESLEAVRALAHWRLALMVFTQLARRRDAAEKDARAALDRLNAINRDFETWYALAMRTGVHALDAQHRRDEATQRL